MAVHVAGTQERDVLDGDLQRLLTDAYVEGGFTAPERAAVIFAPQAVRARGEVLCAWVPGIPRPAGMVIVVPYSSPARRFAVEGEAEMQLLATDGGLRRMGVARALVGAAMDHARSAGARRMLLWTQTSMHAAQALYTSAGFLREPARDFEENGRRFLFFASEL